MKEVWHTLKGWYRLVEDWPLPVCPETMVKQMAKHVELYARVPPMGAALPFNFPHFEISDNMPTDSEMQMVVRGLKNGQASGATGMKAKHLNGWHNEIQCKEKVARENPGREGADPDLSQKCQIFVELIQVVWEQGKIPEQMSWMVVVLLPKGGGDF
jgi:hypothetical protein